jgi:amino acid transporter
VAETTELPRVISRWEIVALSVNDVVGSGVYVILPVAAAALLGPASIWAILAAGLAVLLLVLCFAEAGSLFDKAGGAYVYTREAFGDFVAFEVGWMTSIARLSSVAGLSVFVARTVSYLFPQTRSGIGMWATALAALFGLTAINVRGVKSGARTAVILTWGKIIPLVLFVFVGIFHIHGDRVWPVPMPARENFGKAALLVLFAYAGFENTAAPAGEFKNPRRDIPFALIVTIILVTSVYTLVQLVTIGTIADLKASETPLASATGQMIGPIGGLVLTVGAALSVLGTLNNTILSGPRYLYALAESGMLPSAIARIHPEYRTPYVAILLQSGLAMILMLTGTAEEIAELSVVARLATYVGTAAAVPVLRKKLPSSERAIRLPGGPLIPIGALVMCFAFLSAATLKSLIAGVIALIVGGGIFAMRQGRSPRFQNP